MAVPPLTTTVLAWLKIAQSVLTILRGISKRPDTKGREEGLRKLLKEIDKKEPCSALVCLYTKEWLGKEAPASIVIYVMRNFAEPESALRAYWFGKNALETDDLSGRTRFRHPEWWRRVEKLVFTVNSVGALGMIAGFQFLLLRLRPALTWMDRVTLLGFLVFMLLYGVLMAAEAGKIRAAERFYRQYDRARRK